MDELSLASPQSPGLGFTRPAGATYRVQESRWAEIWGPPRVPATPARRWLRERHALLARTNLGNRFADPLGHYRETYSADCLVGALTECWADDVPHDATVFAGRRVRRTTPSPPRPAGVLPSARVDGRDVITISVPEQEFADVSAVRTRTWLATHPSLRDPLRQVGAAGPRLDSGLLEGLGPRSRIVTQRVGRVIYEHPDVLAGVRYRSRVGDNYINWAVFDRAHVICVNRVPLRRGDPAVVQALADLGL